MELIAEAIGRGGANFLARLSGSLNIRFLIQPTVAALMAVRAGIADARLARPASSLDCVQRSETAVAVVQSGWKDVRNVFLVAAALVAIYQFTVQQFVYPLELLFTSALLAVVPYCVLRGPVSRVARKAMGQPRALLRAID
jgi:hypothetical protein